jgi:hypothetical protein
MEVRKAEKEIGRAKKNRKRWKNHFLRRLVCTQQPQVYSTATTLSSLFLGTMDSLDDSSLVGIFAKLPVLQLFQTITKACHRDRVREKTLPISSLYTLDLQKVSFSLF